MPADRSPSDDPLAFTSRQRDRRRGMGDLLATAARAVTARMDTGLLRGAFEEALRRALPVRTITLRDTASRWPSERSPGGAESVAIEVPGPTPAQRGVLEATFEPGCRLGEWDFQLLGHAAQLAALLLEVERARQQPSARPSTTPAVRPRRDGAAPLIGTTPAMAQLRARIERVAGTDFTILLEGGSDREVANSLSLRFARKCTDRPMAGARQPQPLTV